MKKKKLILIAIVAILGNTSCLTMKNISPNSNTASVRFNKNFVNDTFTELHQIFQQDLNDFPNKKSPIKYNKKTATSTTSIKLKRKKVKIIYYSSSTKEDELEIIKIHRIKAKIEALNK